MSADPFNDFKKMQSQAWGLFAPLEVITTAPAAQLVQFAGIERGQKVLDAACGTGVTAITAARKGAEVKALDLAPVLLERARNNARIANVAIEFKEGDVEALPYADESFDVVVSQYGHMFAPRPEVATRELLRVLRKGGTLAFSTWPPDLLIGRMMMLVGKYIPPPENIPPVTDWGEPAIIRKRLGDAVQDMMFDCRVMLNPSLSPQHSRQQFEQTAAPLIKLVQTLEKEDPQKLATFRQELEALITEYSRENYLHQAYLMTRARKK